MQMPSKKKLLPYNFQSNWRTGKGTDEREHSREKRNARSHFRQSMKSSEAFVAIAELPPTNSDNKTDRTSTGHLTKKNQLPLRQPKEGCKQFGSHNTTGTPMSWRTCDAADDGHNAVVAVYLLEVSISAEINILNLGCCASLPCIFKLQRNCNEVDDSVQRNDKC